MPQNGIEKLLGTSVLGRNGQPVQVASFSGILLALYCVPVAL